MKRSLILIILVGSVLAATLAGCVTFPSRTPLSVTVRGSELYQDGNRKVAEQTFMGVIAGKIYVIYKVTEPNVISYRPESLGVSDDFLPMQFNRLPISYNLSANGGLIDVSGSILCQSPVTNPVVPILPKRHVDKILRSRTKMSFKIGDK